MWKVVEKMFKKNSLPSVVVSFSVCIFADIFSKLVYLCSVCCLFDLFVYLLSSLLLSAFISLSSVLVDPSTALRSGPIAAVEQFDS